MDMDMEMDMEMEMEMEMDMDMDMEMALKGFQKIIAVIAVMGMAMANAVDSSW